MTRPYQASCVALGTRGILIEGPSGAGKSSLALALIDRDAVLVGDDGVMIEVHGQDLIASPHPAIRGKLEVRNLGLFDYPVVEAVRIALVIRLDRDAPRFIDAADEVVLDGIPLPLVRLWPDAPVLALRAELALARYGRT